jgi:hypothetical protein
MVGEYNTIQIFKRKPMSKKKPALKFRVKTKIMINTNPKMGGKTLIRVSEK